jgi:hypothetical protein
LPHQANVFPDREHFGRIFYNMAQMSRIGIPQVSQIEMWGDLSDVRPDQRCPWDQRCRWCIRSRHGRRKYHSSATRFVGATTDQADSAKLN